jgi:hypothetical protein
MPFFLKVERHVARLPAPQDGVDRFIKRTHAVVALGMRTIEPVDGAVGPANKAVGTGGDVDDDFRWRTIAWQRPNPKAERSGFPSSGLREEGTHFNQ